MKSPLRIYMIFRTCLWSMRCTRASGRKERKPILVTDFTETGPCLITATGLTAFPDNPLDGYYYEVILSMHFPGLAQISTPRFWGNVTNLYFNGSPLATSTLIWKSFLMDPAGRYKRVSICASKRLGSLITFLIGPECLWKSPASKIRALKTLAVDTTPTRTARSSRSLSGQLHLKKLLNFQITLMPGEPPYSTDNYEN